MRILSFDCCSKFISISLSEGKEIIGTINFKGSNNLSTHLIPLIDKLLKVNNLTINDIDLFVATNGPGIFTGIRVGLTTLKGFVFSLNKKFLLFDSLYIQALSVKSKLKEQQKILVIKDAKRLEAYCALYEKKENILKEIKAPVIIKFDNLDTFINEYENINIIGDGAKIFKEKSNLNNKLNIIELNTNYFSPFLIEASLEHINSKKTIKRQSNQINVLYLRPPDAKIKKFNA